MSDGSLLEVLLNTLVPGDGADWPAAGSHGLAAKTREMAGLRPDGEKALDALLAMLPAGFEGQNQDEREQVLAKIEGDAPEIFGAVLSATYTAYYTDPGIRDIIERLCGYENRPPQPLGYDLPPFDESLLDQVKARGPIWRAVPET